MSDSLSPRRFKLLLAALLSSVALYRVAYTVVEARVDPWFANPILDGRYYLEWAAALARGGAGPDGAFYLAPLYPTVLSWVLRLSGRSFVWLYLLQQAMGLSTAATLAVGGRRVIGGRAALGAASLYLLYPPFQFFAGRPLSETLAILLLVLSVVVAWRPGARAGFAAGALLGLAALARPNLLLVLPVWAASDLVRRRWPRTAALVLGLALVVLPVTVRNRVVSGHWVLISSNGGITAYHGNGPGARGIYTHPRGFSSAILDQREQATRRARSLSGQPLDAVEADQWWGRRALDTRLERPGETLGLIAWRTALTLDNREWGLDYPPSLDPNPLRLTVRFPWGGEIAFVPWALLIGLCGAAVVCNGWRGSGGEVVWGAVLATAATPVLFYVSTRYRLPTTALLTIPAGVGAVALLRGGSPTAVRWRAAAVAAALALVSLAIPSAALHRQQLAEDLANRAEAYLRLSDLARAETDADRAVALEAGSARSWLTLGRVRLARADYAAAQRAYERALAIEASPEASSGLAVALAGRGLFDDALGVLRRALILTPDHASCWNRLISLLYASGDEPAARAAAERALRAGVELEPGVSEWLDASTGSPE